MPDDTDDYRSDPIAAALLSGSAYDRLRVRRFSYFKQPVPTKLRWQSYLLAALALVAPLGAALPPSVRAHFGGGSPVVVVVAAAGLAVELAAAAGLLGVAATRLRRGPSLSEATAEALLGVEDVASLVGLGTGGLVVGISLAYLLLGHAGAGAVRAYVRAGGRNPFGPSGVGIGLLAVGLAAAAGAVALYVLGRYLGAAFDGRPPA